MIIYNIQLQWILRTKTGCTSLNLLWISTNPPIRLHKCNLTNIWLIGQASYTFNTDLYLSNSFFGFILVEFIQIDWFPGTDITFSYGSVVNTSELTWLWVGHSRSCNCFIHSMDPKTHDHVYLGSFHVGVSLNFLTNIAPLKAKQFLRKTQKHSKIACWKTCVTTQNEMKLAPCSKINALNHHWDLQLHMEKPNACCRKTRTRRNIWPHWHKPCFGQVEEIL